MNLRSAPHGYTLLEVLVAMSIFTFLIVASAEFVVRGLKSTTFGYEQDTAVQNARRASEQMTKEIRETAQSAKGDYPFKTVQPQNLVFFADTNDDGLTEKIRYFMASTTLRRGEIMATGTPLDYSDADETVSDIARYINNQSEPIFTYYDTDNNLLADPTASTSAIRMLHLRLKINVTPSIAPADVLLDTDVQIRNLKDNL